MKRQDAMTPARTFSSPDLGVLASWRFSYLTAIGGNANG
jgi:hypothetical protein